MLGRNKAPRENEITALLRETLQAHGIVPNDRLIRDLRTLYVELAAEHAGTITRELVEDSLRRVGFLPAKSK